MDRRTLLFVLSLTLTLFFVNMFFEQRNQGTAKEWVEQQKAKKIQEKQHLEQEIAERTAKPQDLPAVPLYSDKQSKEFLAYGAKVLDSILTLAWEDQLPNTVFVNGEAFQLASAPKAINDPAIYEKRAGDMLKIGDLPYLGHYELQLVSASTPLTVTLGDYTDGQFSIPSLEVKKLAKQLEEKLEKPELPKSAIVLMQTTEGYLPVAIYDSRSNTFTNLNQIVSLKQEIVKPKAADKSAEEKFYVLENNYQQLVFSNYGGALKEINLPFQTKENNKSVVKEIDFDSRHGQGSSL